ncbi:phosphate ABC transporter permease subunit PstC [Methanosalsum natronophilum]|uniref:phosphate ABC transporter permease subunit PstC n=1 Tax=Methanosalsum natronophilum TaxID=768733 RepID=UPI00216922AA|nr:phosphate ABC transporter permease subunit PstC [Methanosalsum natronophilum]MCS3923014.1 phosphate transport system permease protein [Methanosalsum natronophilum]
MVFKRRHKEKLIEATLFWIGSLTIIILILICLFLFRDALTLFSTHSFYSFVTGSLWYPTADPPLYGLIPLLLGSVLVTFGAICISVPLGITSAIYISEIASPRVASFLKPFIEILAGIPSVVYGFFGLVVLAPYLQLWLDLSTGQVALTGSVMLAVMALPTIISISEDAISSIPSSIREGSLAMGATNWQTIYKVVLPAALSGISAAVMLGMGRAIGETMTVMMVTGNAAVIPGMPEGIVESVRTMTATIALEMGEVPIGSEHYHALFAVGSVLFIMTFLINLAADIIKKKYRFKLEGS